MRSWWNTCSRTNENNIQFFEWYMKASQLTWYIPSLFYSSSSHVCKFFYHHPSAFDLRYINVVYQTFSLWTFRLSSIFCLIMLKFIYESLFFVWLLLQKLLLVSVFNLKKKISKHNSSIRKSDLTSNFPALTFIFIWERLEKAEKFELSQEETLIKMIFDEFSWMVKWLVHVLQTTSYFLMMLVKLKHVKNQLYEASRLKVPC